MQPMLIAFLVVFVSVCQALPQSPLNVQWHQFKLKFNKKYEPKEDLQRQEIFAANLELISKHNREEENGGIHSFRLGINHFADWSHKEYLNFVAGVNGRRHRVSQSSLSNRQNVMHDKSLPDAVDWRDKNVVTPVKNQGGVGQVAIYAAVASLESQQAIESGNLVALSEANVQQCCGNCTDIQSCFDYVKRNHGIDTEAGFPCSSQGCGFCAENVGATCSGSVNVKTGDELALQSAVATAGPVAVYIDASNLSFQFYSTGVYSEENCSTSFLDHAMVVVGYGEEAANEYWIAKNSWGVVWGEDGYVRMTRNKNNQCGIATSAVYPLV